MNLGKQGLVFDLKKKAFRDRVRERSASIADEAERLGDVAAEVDEQRQRAQHREGLALLFHQPGGWYLTLGLQASRDNDVHLPSLLRHWANSIETRVCQVVKSVAS